MNRAETATAQGSFLGRGRRCPFAEGRVASGCLSRSTSKDRRRSAVRRRCAALDCINGGCRRSLRRAKRKLGLPISLSLEITSIALKRRQPAINSCTSVGSHVGPSRAVVCHRRENGNCNPSGPGHATLAPSGGLDCEAGPRMACSLNAGVSMATTRGLHAETTEIFSMSRGVIRRPVSAVLCGHGSCCSISVRCLIAVAEHRIGQRLATKRSRHDAMNSAVAVHDAVIRRVATVSRSVRERTTASRATALSVVSAIYCVTTMVFSRRAKVFLMGGAKGRPRVAAI